MAFDEVLRLYSIPILTQIQLKGVLGFKLMITEKYQAPRTAFKYFSSSYSLVS